MIDENVKIHDFFSLEMKVGFVAGKKQKINDFAFNMWIFIPNSLDINRFTYSKEEFYKDLTSHIRLITPTYLLKNIADQQLPPSIFLNNSIAKLVSFSDKESRNSYEYQLKMFLSIVKSSLREEVSHIIGSKSTIDRDRLIQSYLTDIKEMAFHYRSHFATLNAPVVSNDLLEYYQFGDEFLSNLFEFHTFRLIQVLKERHPETYDRTKEALLACINKEIAYKKVKGYLVVEESIGKNNQELVFHLGMLKKYAESNLYLDVKKGKDGVWVEQILFSLAAGLSMIFATVIAFSFQHKYGTFTMPMFVALIVSYMLKDRIKELSRYYFAHKFNSRYFDHKIKISTGKSKIGWIKESMDFISEKNVPDEILKKRDRSSILEANNRAGGERIIRYQTLMQLNREDIDSHVEYPVAGVNEIFKLNISNFIQKMDNAEFPLYYPDNDEGFKIVHGEKIYYLNLILQAKNREQWDIKRYRIVFNRNGIQKIENFD
ncbi:MAG: hypothetical protein M0Q53_13540 [Prolixibacteraceae bacterium]|nr:hypothetical protein [Prolixibacteraceae bacterium]